MKRLLFVFPPRLRTQFSLHLNVKSGVGPKAKPKVFFKPKLNLRLRSGPGHRRSVRRWLTRHFRLPVVWLVMTCILSFLSLAACQSQATTEKPLVWTGQVLEIYSDQAFLAAVDTDYQKMLGDRAHVALYPSAVVLNAAGKSIKLGSIPVNSRVRVTITGGIRESYPVQVSATRVEWLDG